MQKLLPLLLIFIYFYMDADSGFCGESEGKAAIISVERIWDRAGHNAFTDLIRFNGKLFCTFREGSGHIPGLDGTIRVICTEDGQNWRSVTLISEKDVDLRDPKLSVTPDGRLMVLMGGSFYRDGERLKTETRVSFSDVNGSEFSLPIPVRIDPTIKSNFDWLWRVTWRDRIGYGVVYQALSSEIALRLVSTTDGIHFTYISDLEVSGRANETTLRFLADGRMVALIRRDGEPKEGLVGTSEYPYKTWTINQLNIRVGGPNFMPTPDGKLLAVAREYFPDQRKTSLFYFDLDGNVTRLFSLPSAGDNSYAGMVFDGERLYVSYYSTHEEKTAIYLATIRGEVYEK
ncbi:MAG: hypothetical protein E4H13_07270 [Calditrichales bacterium]|nr:MAG: hypothetical protein E4H13_07270 [Calditrichales bacterium]